MGWLMFFLTIIMYPVLLAMYFVMRAEGKRKGGICFGVAIPGECACDGEMETIALQYHKKLKRNFIILLLLPVLFFFFSSFSLAYTSWMLWLCLLMVFTVTPVVWANKKTAQLKRRCLGGDADDEDRYWKWGLFYHNPQDAHGMVTARVGVGMAVNLAKPWAKALYGFAAAVILSIPIMSVWLIAEEFTPIYLKCEGGVVTAGQLRENYKIPVSDIEEVELVNELPVMSKKSGSGFSNLKKGTFHVRNAGDFETLYNPKNQYVLYIQTADTSYYLGDASDEGTRAVYDTIIKAQ